MVMIDGEEEGKEAVMVGGEEEGYEVGIIEDRRRTRSFDMISS